MVHKKIAIDVKDVIYIITLWLPTLCIRLLELTDSQLSLISSGLIPHLQNTMIIERHQLRMLHIENDIDVNNIVNSFKS